MFFVAMYHSPYEPNGIYKPWASVDYTSKFPCCWGTLAEAFAKLGDSIYFQTPDKSTLFINLFESSSVVWNGVLVSQTASFPLDPSHTTTIKIANKPSNTAAASTIALRVPFWATAQGTSVRNV